MGSPLEQLGHLPNRTVVSAVEDEDSRVVFGDEVSLRAAESGARRLLPGKKEQENGEIGQEEVEVFSTLPLIIGPIADAVLVEAARSKHR